MADLNLSASAPAVELQPGSQIVIDAYDAVTGAPAAGVTVANVGITFDYEAAAGAAAELPALLAYTSGTA